VIGNFSERNSLREFTKPRHRLVAIRSTLAIAPLLSADPIEEEHA
jgi:hypothetical protein